MSTRSQRLLAYFLFALGGSAIGFLVGGYTGSNFGMSLILNSTLSKEALDVQSQLSALRELREGRIEAGIDTIEANIGDTLVLFDPSEPYPGLREDTVATVDNAVRAAWQYRRDFDARDSREHVDDMVEALFEKHGFKP